MRCSRPTFATSAMWCSRHFDTFFISSSGEVITVAHAVRARLLAAASRQTWTWGCYMLLVTFFLLSRHVTSRVNCNLRITNYVLPRRERSSFRNFTCSWSRRLSTFTNKEGRYEKRRLKCQSCRGEKLTRLFKYQSVFFSLLYGRHLTVVGPRVAARCGYRPLLG